MPKKIFPIGKHIKIKPKFYHEHWYTQNILEVVAITKNSKNARIYTITPDLPNEMGNQLHPFYTFSDEECDKYDRKLKLQKLKT